jgi:hypothetical protein
MAKHKINGNHWFVSIQTPRQWRPSSSRTPFARQTKAFLTEAEAKQFAKAMVSDGLKVTAGTLSPHLPRRRQIAAAEIDQWIEEI